MNYKTILEERKEMNVRESGGRKPLLHLPQQDSRFVDDMTNVNREAVSIAIRELVEQSL